MFVKGGPIDKLIFEQRLEEFLRVSQENMGEDCTTLGSNNSLVALYVVVGRVTRGPIRLEIMVFIEIILTPSKYVFPVVSLSILY